MRVLCVDGEPRKGESPDWVPPKEGELYTVQSEEVGLYTDYREVGCYRLAEMPWFWLYEKDRFIPISDIDERDLVEERNEVSEWSR